MTKTRVRRLLRRSCRDWSSVSLFPSRPHRPWDVVGETAFCNKSSLWESQRPQAHWSLIHFYSELPSDLQMASRPRPAWEDVIGGNAGA